MRKWNQFLAATAACGILASAAGGAGQSRESFLRAGDVWVLLGDSITDNDTYRRVLTRVLRHYHPRTDVRLVRRGVSGSLAQATPEQFAKAAARDRPTIVSLMTGMNDSINSAWRAGQPTDGPLKHYRESITKTTRLAKANGLTVLLMSPTLTDESLGWGSMWELAGTAQFLRRAAKVVREVAEAEGAVYLPVAEEFGAAQAKLAPEQIFRADGVHPSALGQYEIARTFLRRLNLSGSLTGKGRTMTAALPLGVKLSLQSRFLTGGATKITFDVRAPRAMTVTATWSCGDMRGRRTLKLTGKDTWTLELPDHAAKLGIGQADDVVIDLTDGRGRALYLVDLCKVPVMHLTDGEVRGTITGPADRPEGAKAVEWTVRVAGKGLLIEAEVFDAEIRSDYSWPWGQDGLSVWLDFRPTARFADIGIDSDCYLAMLHPYEKPRFAVKLRPWLGRGLDKVGVAGGVRTRTGYKCYLSIRDGRGQMQRFSKWSDSDLSKRDFIGLNFVLTDADTVAKVRYPRQQFLPALKTSNAPDRYGNGFIILDLKNKLPGDSVVNVHLSQLLP